MVAILIAGFTFLLVALTWAITGSWTGVLVVLGSSLVIGLLVVIIKKITKLAIISFIVISLAACLAHYSGWIT